MTGTRRTPCLICGAETLGVSWAWSMLCPRHEELARTWWDTLGPTAQTRLAVLAADSEDKDYAAEKPWKFRDLAYAHEVREAD